METKTVAFAVRDLEQFKEYFPDYKSGKMSGRELGSKLLEIVKNQIPNSELPSIQSNDHLKRLPLDHCNQLGKQFARTEPSVDDLQSSKQKLKIRLKHYFRSSKTKTTMNFYLTIKKTKRNGNKNTSI